MLRAILTNERAGRVVVPLEFEAVVVVISDARQTSHLRGLHLTHALDAQVVQTLLEAAPAATSRRSTAAAARL